MVGPQEQFIVDAKGKKTGVVLSLRQYRKLMEDLHDLAVIAERRREKPVPFDELKRRLRKDASYKLVVKPSVERDLRSLSKPMIARALE